MNRPLLLVAFLLGCQSNPNEATFTQNVGEAFQECRAQEVTFLAGKHNFMTAFEPCGSNNFSEFAWNPAGTLLYFQLTQTGFIMNADVDNRATVTLPTETVVGPGAWVTDTRIAVPVQAPEGSDTMRMAIYDFGEQASMFYIDVPGVSDIDDMQLGDTVSQVLFTALQDGKRQVHMLDLDDSTVSQPWPWLGTVDTFTYAKPLQRVFIGRGDTVEMISLGSQETEKSWSPATRGVLHPDSRWLALEHEGEPVSIFYQRAWDELPPKARERELRRAKEWEDGLPEWYPKEVNPPTISIVNMETDERWMFTGFHGEDFAWYPAADFYASLILWGFEGKELNRNVLLGNLHDRLRSMEKGEEMFGVKRFGDTKAPATPATPAAPAAEPAGEPEQPPAVTLEK